MQGYHTQWGGDFELFEIVTQIASAAAWSYHYGKLDFYGDRQSIERLSELELAWMYREIQEIKICPERTKRIWAWPKIEAMGFADTKNRQCCSVDIDCVVWTRLNINPEIALYGLHYDCGNWPVYHEIRPLMKMVAPTLNFDVQPINAGLMYFQNPALRRGFLKMARIMAEAIMALPLKLSKDAGSVSIEQLMAPALALGMGRRVDVFEEIANPQTKWHPEPDRVTHVWGWKKIYSNDSLARESFLSHLINQVGKFDPVSAMAMEALAEQDRKATKNK